MFCCWVALRPLEYLLPLVWIPNAPTCCAQSRLLTFPAQFPHMWKLCWLPGSQASAVGKAPQNVAWTTQLVRGLSWNVGSRSRARQNHTATWGVPSVGGGSLGPAGKCRQIPWVLTRGPGNIRSGHSLPGFHLVGFCLQAVHSTNIFRLWANGICQAEGREAQGESREEVERVKLLRWDAFNKR